MALYQALLERLHGAGTLDWSRAALDSASVPAKRMARPVGKWFLGLRLDLSAQTYPAFRLAPLAKMESRASWSS